MTWLGAIGIATLGYGCGGACSDAQSLCEECEVDPERCERLFADADSDFCEAAVETYEASCAEE